MNNFVKCELRVGIEEAVLAGEDCRLNGQKVWLGQRGQKGLYVFITYQEAERSGTDQVIRYLDSIDLLEVRYGS